MRLLSKAILLLAASPLLPGCGADTKPDLGVVPPTIPSVEPPSVATLPASEAPVVVETPATTTPPALAATSLAATAVVLPISALVGADFEVVLDANATTGFKWILAPGFDATKVVNSLYEYQSQPTDPLLVGAGGRARFVFKALSKGEVELTFRYVRPFDKDATDARTETRKVVIQ